jgi:tetratricopeptide (TPR) repeat protein
MWFDTDVIEILAGQVGTTVAAVLVHALKERGLWPGLKQRLADRRSATRVADAKKLVDEAETVLWAAVAAERARRVPWEVIGDALGITRSAAHSRFADRINASRDADAEQDLRQAWQSVLDLAGKQVTPLTHSIAELMPEDRQPAIDMLASLIRDRTAPDETRLASAMFLATIEGDKQAKVLERLLRESPVSTETMSSVAQPAGEVTRDAYDESEISMPHRLILQAAVHQAPSHEDLDHAIMGFEAVLQLASDRAALGPKGLLVQENLAIALLIRFDRRQDRMDLERAIDLIRSLLTVSTARRVERLSLLAEALHHRYGHMGDAAALQEAIMILNEAAHEAQDTLGADHPDTLATFHELALRIAETGHADEAVELFRRLLTGRERVLGADHPDTIRTRSAYLNALLARFGESHDPAALEQVNLAAMQMLTSSPSPRHLGAQLFRDPRETHSSATTRESEHPSSTPGASNDAKPT